MSKILTTTEKLIDDPGNRKKYEIMEKMEVMIDDSRNGDYQSFWCYLDDFLEWGKTYRITIEEVTDA